MMKRPVYKATTIFLAMGLILLATACSEDFFNRTAGDRITPDQHYNNIIDGQISMVGAISYLQNAMPNYILYNGLRSDAMMATSNADQYLRELSQGIYSEFNPYTATSDFYKVIINLNEVLEHLDELAANERELDDYTTFYYRGGILAMRAWVYFRLACIHGEVTYLPDNMESLPDELIEPWPKSVIIDTLIRQIEPYIYDPDAGQEKLEVSLPLYVNPKGILGEMYLEIGDYANAQRYLKMACESYGNSNAVFKVDNTYQAEGWATMFLNAESAFTENLSVMPFTSTEGQNNPLPRWLGYDLDYLVKPSQVLVDSFMAQVVPGAGPGDVYRGLGVSFGVDTLSKTSETDFETANYVHKYSIDQADPLSTDIILQRAADLHLLLAEAHNRLGGEDAEQLSLMFVNFGVADEKPKPSDYIKWSRNVGVRGRAKLNIRTVPEDLSGDARMEYIEDMIIQERALELAFEGQRWFDLVRIAERRNDPSYLADRVAAKYEGTPLYDVVHDRLMNPENWYIPAR